MRMDLPCCGFENCRYVLDGNCTALESKRKFCEYKEYKENKNRSEQFVKLPLEFGTFVRVLETGRIGTVNAFTVLDGVVLIWVSGYKESWCEELHPDEVAVLSEVEVKEICKEDYEEK